MYRIIWKEEAKRNLRKIRRSDPTTAKEIETQVESHLASNPKQNGKPLEHQWKGYYRYVVGDYRVIYQIEERQLIILIVEVGERNARQKGSIYGRKPPRLASGKQITTIERPKARDHSRKVVGDRGRGNRRGNK